MNALSRKIIAQMPVRTGADIKARESAHKKLREAEELVDKFHARFEATMAKDGQTEDTADLKHVVQTENKKQSDDRFDFERSLASNLRGVKHLTHYEWSVIKPNSVSERQHVFETELKMVTDEKRGTTEYSIKTENHGYWGRNPADQVTNWLGIGTKVKPSKYLLVKGEGEDREFRFTPLNRKERIWQKATDLASSAAGLLEPLKKLPLPKISLGE